MIEKSECRFDFLSRLSPFKEDRITIFPLPKACPLSLVGTSPLADRPASAICGVSYTMRSDRLLASIAANKSAASLRVLTFNFRRAPSNR